jgi:cation transport regulator
MPHNNLPEDVTTRLPLEAQAIYQQAFEDAWKRYGRTPRDESRAHAVAWAAVKREFHENEVGEWEAGAPERDTRHPKRIDDRRIF